MNAVTLSARRGALFDDVTLFVIRCVVVVVVVVVLVVVHGAW